MDLGGGAAELGPASPCGVHPAAASGVLLRGFSGFRQGCPGLLGHGPLRCPLLPLTNLSTPFGSLLSFFRLLPHPFPAVAGALHRRDLSVRLDSGQALFW